MVLVAAVALLFSGYSLAKADMYSYVDEHGTRNFTNVPAVGQARLYEHERVTISRPSAQSWPDVRVGGRSHFSKSSAAYDHHIRQSASLYNVDPRLIKAIIKAESGFDCNARSQMGAQGLMQLMPDTARDLHVSNPFDPRANIDGGTRYFRTMLDTFNGDIPLSLAAYNAGPNLVKRTNRMPQIPETMEYVRRVLHNYKGYRGSGRQLSPVSSAISVGELVMAR
jgi:soluble lytic murein transglycosylase-like protein